MNWTSDAQGCKSPQINVLDQQMLLADLRAHLLAQSGFSVATLNLDHVVKLRTDAAFCAAYSTQTHVTADGRPIVWLSRLAGDQVSLVTGSDLLDPMVALCAELGVPIAFFGSTQDVLDAAAQKLEAKYPALRISAKIAPPMGCDPNSAETEKMIREINDTGARVCFLALGAPKQELIAANGREICPDMGFLSIGASLDFVAGVQVRAPGIFRALAAEWLWRLARNPKRLAARYAACFAVLPGLMIRAVGVRTGQQPRASNGETE